MRVFLVKAVKQKNATGEIYEQELVAEFQALALVPLPPAPYTFLVVPKTKKHRNNKKVIAMTRTLECQEELRQERQRAVINDVFGPLFFCRTFFEEKRAEVGIPPP